METVPTLALPHLSVWKDRLVDLVLDQTRDDHVTGSDEVKDSAPGYEHPAVS